MGTFPELEAPGRDQLPGEALNEVIMARNRGQASRGKDTETAGHSDLATTPPISTASAASATTRFVACSPPVDPGRFVPSLLLHARDHAAPSHVWLMGTSKNVAI